MIAWRVLALKLCNIGTKHLANNSSTTKHLPVVYLRSVLYVATNKNEAKGFGVLYEPIKIIVVRFGELFL